MEACGTLSVRNLEALSALLSSQQEEDCKNVTTCAELGPGHLGPPRAPEPPPQTHRGASTSCVKNNTKDIWSEDEVCEGPHYDDLCDPRPQPEYEIIWKQNVSPEDVFLGLSRKDPSSMSCEDVLVKINLPDTKAADVVLDVKETFLDLRTPKYKLGLHLPHPVCCQEGSAHFFSEREQLEVTLRINRPTDSVHKQ